MKKTIALLLPFFVVLLSCKKGKNLTREADYQRYLQPEKHRELTRANEQELAFWSARLSSDTGNYVYQLELGRYQLQQFRLTGNVASLHRGDSLLTAASAKLANQDPEILFALAQNSISLHRFKKAAAYNELAEQADPDRFTLCLLQIDVALELGQYATVAAKLRQIKDKKGFDYLIRRAKWEDHQGDLSTAIRFMEQALEKAKGRKNLFTWALSNLADMYGHAGRVKESYHAYLQVLEQDPTDLHALQGIAWIAYAHDHDPARARQVLNYILSVREQPELKLVLAEIAGFEGNPAEQQKMEAAFLADISRPGYGAMYNKYLIPLLAGELDQPAKAVLLAKQELGNRFTPETCDWLAWSYFRNGETDSAYAYANGYVYGYTREPAALMHTAYIFAAHDRKKEAGKLFRECLESSFELGPVSTSLLQEQLVR